MTRKNPPAKWVLPNVVDPPTSTCWRVPVPDDPFHRAAFLGALAALGSAYKWQDDVAHTAKQVADVWRRIADDLERCQDITEIIKIYESEETMPIRTDCDCRVWALCCDGTEKELATVAMLSQPTQPGSGTPQPKPGTSQCYSGHLIADKFWLIPTIVSTGDVITIGAIEGATSDNHIDWYCPDGSIFFAGNCGGGGGTKPTDVAPTLQHMQVICEIAGVYYSAKPGDTITVPSGVTNAIALLRMNCVTDPAGNSGDLTLSVCVANNAAVTWAHTIDLLTTAGGFLFRHSSASPFDQQGTWIAATGLQTTLVTGPSEYDTYLDAYWEFSASTTLTRVKITYDETLGANGISCSLTNLVQYIDGGGTPHNLSTQSAANGSGQVIDWAGSQSAKGIELIAWPGCDHSPTDPGGVGTITQLIVEGTGFDPFV